MDVEEKIARLTEFKSRLTGMGRRPVSSEREWLNQNVDWVRTEVAEAGRYVRVTISPPPIVGGLVFNNVDPFGAMFDAPYGKSMAPTICDMIDRTIGVLRNPPPAEDVELPPQIQQGYAFIAMAMDKDDHHLVDVLEAIKEAAKDCSIQAERVDDVESNERITDRILQSIRRAEFVIVDLTHERPNVFYEAGYAHGLGKVPIFLARAGTVIHFDIKDYPIIIFRNMRELKDGLRKRLMALMA